VNKLQTLVTCELTAKSRTLKKQTEHSWEMTDHSCLPYLLDQQQTQPQFMTDYTSSNTEAITICRPILLLHDKMETDRVRQYSRYCVSKAREQSSTHLVPV